MMCRVILSDPPSSRHGESTEGRAARRRVGLDTRERGQPSSRIRGTVGRLGSAPEGRRPGEAATALHRPRFPARFLRRYLAGASCVNIGADAGLTKSAVATRLRRKGVQLRPGGKGPGSGRLDLPVPEILERYRAGETIEAIGRSLGASTNAIRARLKKAGVERRRRGEVDAD